jgi:hypothetical protein
MIETSCYSISPTNTILSTPLAFEQHQVDVLPSKRGQTPRADRQLAGVDLGHK